MRKSFLLTFFDFVSFLEENMSDFLEMWGDAVAYVTDPEAREISEFKYPSGSPMSIRAAKKAGKM